jgi:hypothetical protein
MKKSLIRSIRKDGMIAIGDDQYIDEYGDTDIGCIMVDSAIYDAVVKSLQDKDKARSWFVDTLPKCIKKWSKQEISKEYERKVPGTKTRAVFSLAFVSSRKGRGMCVMVRSKNYIEININNHNEHALYSILLGR